MILTIVASVAVLAPPPPDSAAPGTVPRQTLVRHAPPLAIPGPPEGLERPTSPPRSLTHRRDHKAQGLVPQPPVVRPAMRIGGWTGASSRRWHRASSPRPPRGPPLPT